MKTMMMISLISAIVPYYHWIEPKIDGITAYMLVFIPKPRDIISAVKTICYLTRKKYKASDR